MELYQYRKIIGENLSRYIRIKGYSKSSFAKLSGVSRPTLNQILLGESPNARVFQEQISRIAENLKLSAGYFLNEPAIQNNDWGAPSVQFSDQTSGDDRDPKATELLQSLEDLMDIAALYL